MPNWWVLICQKAKVTRLMSFLNLTKSQRTKSSLNWMLTTIILRTIMRMVRSRLDWRWRLRRRLSIRLSNLSGDWEMMNDLRPSPKRVHYLQTWSVGIDLRFKITELLQTLMSSRMSQTMRIASSCTRTHKSSSRKMMKTAKVRVRWTSCRIFVRRVTQSMQDVLTRFLEDSSSV